MADENQLTQEEIERMLAQAGMKGTRESPPVSGGNPEPNPSSTAPEGGSAEARHSSASRAESQNVELDQKEIEALISSPSSGKSAPPKASAQTVSDAEKVLTQDEIERLLGQTGRGPVAPKSASSRETKPEIQPVEQEMAPEDMEYLFHQAEQALASIETPTENMPPGVTVFRLEEFSGAPPSTEAATLDLIRDVELDLRIELGRTQMYLEDVLRLRRGSVVPLDKLAGDPVDIYVNDRLIARGEVLVLNDNFCVRVAELLAGVGPEST